MKFGVLVPCGPSPLESARISDLMDALWHFGGECAQIVMVNDGNPHLAQLDLGILEKKYGCRIPVEILQNPRNGEGWGWAGGLVYGELAGLHRLKTLVPDLGFVIKLDTDALPIRPFHADLALRFKDPGIGLVGSRIINEIPPAYKQTQALGYFRNKTNKLLAPISLWRKPTWHLRSPLLDKDLARIREMLQEAISNGYVKGELIEGGAFAWSGDYIDRLINRGFHTDRSMLLKLNVSDDLFLTPLAYCLGLHCEESDIFCVEPANLRFPAAELWERCPNARIIHSVKGGSPEYEASTRDFFRNQRDSRRQFGS